MTNDITKRSKATYYKHRLDKALLILDTVDAMKEKFEFWGIENLFDFQDEMRPIFEDIERLKEDLDND